MTLQNGSSTTFGIGLIGELREYKSIKEFAIPNNLVIRALATLVLASGFSGAVFGVEPTHLEPVEANEEEAIEVQQQLIYRQAGHNEFESETEIEYAIGRRLVLGISIPVEREEADGTEVGDIGLFAESVLNPDNESGVLVGGKLELFLPTGEHRDNLGGEAQLRLSKYLGEQKASGVHLTLSGRVNDFEESHDGFDTQRDVFSRLIRERHEEEYERRGFSFGATAGYSYNMSERTTLTTNLFYQQAYEGEDDAVLLEAGISRDFNDSVSTGLGIGVGLDSDSPDFELRAIVSFGFGRSKGNHLGDERK